MNDNVAKEFEAFRKQCIWLRSCYNTFQALYDSGDETKELLIKAAGWFFYDLNMVLQEYSLLQISKITEKASTCGRDNLTIYYIDKLLKDNNLMTENISACSRHLNDFGEKLKLCRHRLLAHFDKETILTNNMLKTFDSKEDVEKFFSYLQEYTDEVGREVGTGPLDYSASNGPGDVYDLIEKLRAG